MDASDKKANLIFWPIAIVLFILWLIWVTNSVKDYKPPILSPEEEAYMEEKYGGFEPYDGR